MEYHDVYNPINKEQKKINVSSYQKPNEYFGGTHGIRPGDPAHI